MKIKIMAAGKTLREKLEDKLKGQLQESKQKSQRDHRSKVEDKSRKSNSQIVPRNHNERNPWRRVFLPREFHD